MSSSIFCFGCSNNIASAALKSGFCCCSSLKNFFHATFSLKYPAKGTIKPYPPFTINVAVCSSSTEKPLFPIKSGSNSHFNSPLPYWSTSTMPQLIPLIAFPFPATTNASYLLPSVSFFNPCTENVNLPFLFFNSIIQLPHADCCPIENPPNSCFNITNALSYRLLYISSFLPNKPTLLL